MHLNFISLRLLTFLICCFLAAAEAVLDRCVTTSNEYDLSKTMLWVKFSYEFLDDMCVEHSEESLIEWRLKGSARDHPLALMVSLLNTSNLQLHSGVWFVHI